MCSGLLRSYNRLMHTDRGALSLSDLATILAALTDLTDPSSTLRVCQVRVEHNPRPQQR